MWKKSGSSKAFYIGKAVDLYDRTYGHLSKTLGLPRAKKNPASFHEALRTMNLKNLRRLRKLLSYRRSLKDFSSSSDWGLTVLVQLPSEMHQDQIPQFSHLNSQLLSDIAFLLDIAEMFFILIHRANVEGLNILVGGDADFTKQYHNTDQKKKI